MRRIADLYPGEQVVQQVLCGGAVSPVRPCNARRRQSRRAAHSQDVTPPRSESSGPTTAAISSAISAIVNWDVLCAILSLRTLTLEPSFREGVVFFLSAHTQAFRPPDQPRWVAQRRRLRFRSPGSAQRMATVGHPRPGVPAELALRKPQGSFRVPTDLAVRGAASLVKDCAARLPSPVWCNEIR
jgi:hypothetical protein